MDSSGNVIWKRFYNRTGIRCYDIIRTSDGNFLACGEQLTLKGFQFRYDSYVMKLDQNGNLIWDTTYQALFDKPLKSVAEITGQGFMFTGYNRNFISDTIKCIIVKTNYFGGIIFEKYLKVFNLNADGIKIINYTDGVFICGNTRDTIMSIGRVYLLKTDLAGNTKYVNYLNSNQTEKATNFISLNDNRLAISTHDNIDVAKILVADTSGNILLQNRFPTLYYDFIFSILPLPNGDILWGGGGRFSVEDSDVWIIRSDSLLNFPVIGINSNNTILPKNFKLYQNYPNPFNPETNIKYEIPKDANVTIKVYDILGREVFSIIEFKKAGSYEVKFDGSKLASGMYLYKLVVGDNTNNGVSFSDTKKMVLLK